MNTIKNWDALNKVKETETQNMAKAAYRILICAGTGCLAGGSADICRRLTELCAGDPQIEIVFAPEAASGEEHTCSCSNSVSLHKSGCHGFCEMGPLVRIEPAGILYTKVKLSDCEEIYEKTIRKGEVVHRLLFTQDGIEYQSQEEIPFYKKQTRLVLENCGHIDAERIEEAIASGTYQALAKALFTMTPQEVIDEILQSNLRGRGGGGFLTGVKWQQVAK